MNDTPTSLEWIHGLPWVHVRHLSGELTQRIIRAEIQVQGREDRITCILYLGDFGWYRIGFDNPREIADLRTVAEVMAERKALH